jgi:transcription antitermination factor NusG
MREAPRPSVVRSLPRAYDHLLSVEALAAERRRRFIENDPLLRGGDTSWFALRVKSNMEFKVRASLQGFLIETFLPTWSEDVRWSDRVKRTERPLFPGYLFVRIAPGPDFYRSIQTRGVIQILPNSFNPAPIDEKEIEAVRLVVASKLHTAPCSFEAGELVTIESGPLAGVKGVITKTKGALRVVVSVELLRRSIAVELDADTLLKVQVEAA